MGKGTLRDFILFLKPSINVTVCEALRWRPAKFQAMLLRAKGEEHGRELQQKQPVVPQENALNNRLLATAFSLLKTGIKTVLLCCWPVGEQQPLNSSQDTRSPAPWYKLQTRLADTNRVHYLTSSKASSTKICVPGRPQLSRCIHDLLLGHTQSQLLAEHAQRVASSLLRLFGTGKLRWYLKPVPTNLEPKAHGLNSLLTPS